MLFARSLSGAAIPMDPTPLAEPWPDRELGVFVLVSRRRDGDDDAPLAMPLATMSALAFATAAEHKVPLFVSHFATCPNADSHRRAS